VRNGIKERKTANSGQEKGQHLVRPWAKGLATISSQSFSFLSWQKDDLPARGAGRDCGRAPAISGPLPFHSLPTKQLLRSKLKNCAQPAARETGESIPAKENI